jgi:ammonia channel protein AmtB
LGIAKLLFLVGVLVGFLETGNFILGSQSWVLFLSPTYSSSGYLAAATMAILWHTSVSIAAAILSWNCYRNLNKGKLKVVGLRGVVSGALLIITGMWLPGFFVVIAGIISHIYQMNPSPS